MGREIRRLIIKPLSKISSFCARKPNLNPPFSHVLAQRLTNTPRRNLQVAMGRKRIPHAYRHNPLCCNEGLINALYIFNLGFFFSAGHEISAFANQFRALLFLINQLLFSRFSLSHTMESTAELLSELHIHINSSKAGCRARPADF